jgi:4-hydroxy-3-methylbut-2-enyl diphosphate reductase
MEENFEELFNNSIKDVKLGKTATGKIIEITSKKEIIVDLGYKADGIIPLSEYSFDLEKDPNDEFKVGDTITADVLKMNDGLGNVLLSYKKIKSRVALQELEQKIENKEIFKEKVADVNNNGLIVEYKGIRIFIPMSLSCISKNEDIQEYKGKEVEFLITEYDRKTKKIIGSIKEIRDEEKRKIENEFWQNVEVGKEYEGTVTSISSYGAFVEIEKGIQGLLHVSEISWERNIDVHDILKENQKINVIIKELDKENKRIKLSSKLKGEDPWNKVAEKYNVNDIVEVKIDKFMQFGAFAEIEPGIEGLIHISQISEERITKPEEKLKIGQKLNAKIIDIDIPNKKIGLSIKELEGTSYDPEYADEIAKINN